MKSVYKGTFYPSQVACPHTFEFVYLDDKVRKQITDEIKPHLSENKKTEEELEAIKKDLLSKGLRA